MSYASHMQRWQRRFFVLDQNSLRYYLNPLVSHQISNTESKATYMFVLAMLA